MTRQINRQRYPGSRADNCRDIVSSWAADRLLQTVYSRIFRAQGDSQFILDVELNLSLTDARTYSDPTLSLPRHGDRELSFQSLQVQIAAQINNTPSSNASGSRGVHKGLWPLLRTAFSSGAILFGQPPSGALHLGRRGLFLPSLGENDGLRFEPVVPSALGSRNRTNRAEERAFLATAAISRSTPHRAPRRAGYLAMLTAAARGEFDVLVAEDISRL